MNWVIATDVNSWVNRLVPTEHRRFTPVPKPESSINWHLGNSPTTTLRGFAAHWQHARLINRARPDGIIAIFPQLAAVLGMQQRLRIRRVPIVAWHFNMGKLYRGHKALVARMAFRDVSRFVVHTEAERHLYSELLGLPLDRFRFVRCHHGAIPPLRPEETQRPFLLAMGSAGRDYRTLFDVVSDLNLRTIVVANDFALRGLKIPDCVEVRSKIPYGDCLVLAQQGRISVVPISNNETASGQVTVVGAMRMGRPVIATRCLGTTDYIEHGLTGWLTEPGSKDDLAEAITTLWHDESRRAELAANGYRYAEVHLSHEAAAAALDKILSEFEPTHAAPIEAGASPSQVVRT